MPEYGFKPPPAVGEESSAEKQTEYFVGEYPQAWQLSQTKYRGWKMFVEANTGPAYEPKPSRNKMNPIDK